MLAKRITIHNVCGELLIARTIIDPAANIEYHSTNALDEAERLLGQSRDQLTVRVQENYDRWGDRSSAAVSNAA